MGTIRPNNSELCLIIPICSELFRVVPSRGDWIRTSDLFVPNEARYRAALRPDIFIANKFNDFRKIFLVYRKLIRSLHLYTKVAAQQFLPMHLIFYGLFPFLAIFSIYHPVVYHAYPAVISWQAAQ